MPKLLVVNLHGLIDVPLRTRTAITGLGITKKFSATVVHDDAVTVGALKRCKDYLAWGELDVDTLAALLESRAKVNHRKRLDTASLKSLGFKDFRAMAKSILESEKRLSAVSGILPYFSLHPPRGGFKRSTRRQFREGGILGQNAELLGVVRRML